MPLVDSNDGAIWDSFYRCWTADGTRECHYDRAVKDRILGEDHWKLRDALALQPGQRIVIIGAGFGWVAEDWMMSGLGPVLAVDTSKWIHARKIEHARIPIYNADILTEDGRNALRMGGGFTWAISEDVLPILSDDECRKFGFAMRKLAPRIAHWVSVKVASGDPRLNWKTLEEWKSLMGDDRVVQRGTAMVL